MQVPRWSLSFGVVVAAMVAVAASHGDASAPLGMKVRAEPVTAASVASAAALASSSPSSVPAPIPAPPTEAAAEDHAAPPASPPSSGPDYHDDVSEATQEARGAYFSGPYVRRHGARGIVHNLESAGLNAAVVDMKDGQGRVTYDSAIELLAPQERHFIRDPAALVRELKSHGVYTIARVVCFSDPQLAAATPDRAILDSRPGRRGRPWVSWGTGGTWLDPYNRDNHDLVLALAMEAASFGYDEVQLDYIRFPVDDGIEFAEFPARTEERRSEVLLRLLRRIDAAIQVPLAVDVFGLTAFDFGDPSVLGQELERWVPHVEVFTPMLYLNSMTAWGHQLDNRAYSLIRIGTSSLRERLGPVPVIRPFLQGFEQGSDRFDPEFIADQVRGARRGGADGFLFWHPRNNYGMVTRGMRGPARHLTPFPTRGRVAAREQATERRSHGRGAPAAGAGSTPAH